MGGNPWGLLHALLGEIPIFVGYLLSPFLKPILPIFGGSMSDIGHLVSGSLACFVVSLAVGLVISNIKYKAICGAIMVESPVFLPFLATYLIPFVDPYFYICSDVGLIFRFLLLLLTPGILIIGAVAGVLVGYFIKACKA